MAAMVGVHLEVEGVGCYTMVTGGLVMGVFLLLINKVGSWTRSGCMDRGSAGKVWNVPFGVSFNLSYLTVVSRNAEIFSLLVNQTGVPLKYCQQFPEWDQQMFFLF
jgi:hypothetical protein